MGVTKGGYLADLTQQYAIWSPKNACPLQQPTLAALRLHCTSRSGHTAFLRSTILTLLTSIIQLVALVWYLVSYFPMGSQGLRFAASFGGSRLSAWMGG
ncbi:hypothetical protein AC578_8785 [Pseudocercospora eumusae]|uniref:Uncharacterized protein n=1 Tax=Pseudocercospora eumusae TaxID=321146 RepID=A0A139H6D6_9PEZI|nr:hypothetical protein AC578_8785 [Pseudocercospora eumusae]